MPISVVVANDQDVVCHGLRSILSHANFEITAEVRSTSALAEELTRAKPDVLILDPRLPGGGLEFLEKLRGQNSDLRVVVLTAHDTDTILARSSALGVLDFLLLNATKQAIVDSVIRAAQGQSAGPDSLLQKMRSSMTRRREGIEADVPLTSRELQVLRHVALGLSNREIGRSLTISIETVKEHVQNILRKIDVADRTQAAVWAVKRGIV